MPKMIFVNLPIKDVQRSRAFYLGLGFTINEKFSDDSTACVIISDQIYLMILEHARFEGFAPRPLADITATTSALIALSCDSRADVDAMMAAALKGGATDNDKLQEMEGFMYGRSFSDPDGHVFEPFWMNPAAKEG